MLKTLQVISDKKFAWDQMYLQTWRGSNKPFLGKEGEKQSIQEWQSSKQPFNSNCLQPHNDF